MSILYIYLHDVYFSFLFSSNLSVSPRIPYDLQTITQGKSATKMAVIKIYNIHIRLKLKRGHFHCITRKTFVM